MVLSVSWIGILQTKLVLGLLFHTECWGLRCVLSPFIWSIQYQIKFCVEIFWWHLCPDQFFLWTLTGKYESVWPILEYGVKDLHHCTVKLSLAHMKATYISIWSRLMTTFLLYVCMPFLTSKSSTFQPTTCRNELNISINDSEENAQCNSCINKE